MTASGSPVLSVELRAAPTSVATARHRVLAYAREHTQDTDVLERLAIAVSEAVTNAVRHAYPDAPAEDDTVGVFADVEHGTLEVVVVDAGQGIHAGTSSPGLGAGLSLISQCADGIAIQERVPAGTEIRMRFALP